jgi:DNA helicase-4
MADLDGTREDFEKALKQRIESTGNKVEKLPEEELFEKAVTIQEPRVVSMFIGYINKALSKRLSATDLDSMIESLVKSNEKQGVKYVVEYSSLANKVYQQYINRLKSENRIDYYGLLELAIKKVNASKGDCSIVRKEHDYVINLSDLEYLLIDEYQDFSPLFYDLVDSIRKHNANLKLFCVGDDWQAINSFAGSDLDYFLKFKEYFKDAKKMYLLTNYRSNANIVNLSNNLMPEEWGKPSVPHKEDVGYGIKNIFLNDVFVDMNDPWMRKVSKEPLSKRRQQLIALCRKQISEHPDNSILILRRTHRGENKHNSLDSLIEQLKRACLGIRDSSDFVTRDGNARTNHFVEVSTFHSSKGREADIVIILDVAPLVHPDVQLNLVFDNDYFHHAQDEERRLFYVALTRAKERLIFAINPNKSQDYLYDLNLEGSVIKQ